MARTELPLLGQFNLMLGLEEWMEMSMAMEGNSVPRQQNPMSSLGSGFIPQSGNQEQWSKAGG